MQIAIAGLTRFFGPEHADVVYIDAPHAASGPAYEDVLQVVIGHTAIHS